MRKMYPCAQCKHHKFPLCDYNPYIQEDGCIMFEFKKKVIEEFLSKLEKSIALNEELVERYIDTLDYLAKENYPYLKEVVNRRKIIDKKYKDRINKLKGE